MDPTTPPANNLPLPQSTPIKTSSSTTFPFTTTQKYRVESRTAMADEMKRFIVGPMPAREFLDDFLPTDRIPHYRKRDFRSGIYDQTVNNLKVKDEKKAYIPFIDVSAAGISTLEFVNSSNTSDANPLSKIPFKIRPDVSIYPVPPGSSLICNSALVEIHIEFKCNSIDDPFGDVQYLGPDRRTFLHNTKTAHDTLGQITSYAATQLGAQFRTHIFSVFICSDSARLIRWDRSGVIVTEAIEYNKCDLLYDFFTRYSMACPAMRGKDGSVTDPSPAEEYVARRALNLGAEIPLVKLLIPHADQFRYFVASAPVATLCIPAGRATRGFKAYDLFNQKVVFVKDSWRIDLDGIMAEGKVYEILRDAEARHVPYCLAAGDILCDDYHATKAQIYAEKPWACHSTKLVPHRHYRLSLDIVGRVLVEYTSTYEMVSAVRNALIAHNDAYKANVLHRDISPGNIIIDASGGGWLIDWDLSKLVSTPHLETPRTTMRTGTWQFMSAKLISEPSALHGVLDDLESSLYVLLWVVLMYSEVSDRDQVPTFLAGVLDPRPVNDKGGFGKEDFLNGQSFLKNVSFPGRPSLLDLIKELATLFHYRYKDQPGESERKEWQNLTTAMKANPTLKTTHQNHPCTKYDEYMLNLNHDGTLKLFDRFLMDRSEWPVGDLPKKQVFELALSSKEVLKSELGSSMR